MHYSNSSNRYILINSREHYYIRIFLYAVKSECLIVSFAQILTISIFERPRYQINSFDIYKTIHFDTFTQYQNHQYASEPFLSPRTVFQQLACLINLTAFFSNIWI